FQLRSAAEAAGFLMDDGDLVATLDERCNCSETNPTVSDNNDLHLVIFRLANGGIADKWKWDRPNYVRGQCDWWDPSISPGSTKTPSRTPSGNDAEIRVLTRSCAKVETLSWFGVVVRAAHPTTVVSNKSQRAAREI